MIVNFFTKGDRSAGSSRQRAFLVAENLNRQGIQAIVYEPSLSLVSQSSLRRKVKLLWRYLLIFSKIKQKDVIFLQRAIYNKYFFVMIVCYKLFFRRKIIFDFDDAVYLHSPWKTKILVKLANVVIVGSHSLANWAKEYNKNVCIIPTSIDFACYSRFSKEYGRGKKEIILGWVGNAVDHYNNLKILKPVFRDLINQKINFSLVLVGSLSCQKVYDLFTMDGLKVEFVDSLDWSREGVVPAIIQKFDIGLMPLKDNEWNRGKCAFKAVEYMACGVPVVISAVGENNYLVQDGKNGFLSETTEEWVHKIKMLYDNRNLLKKIGKAGQKTVKARYSYEASISTLRRILNNL